MYTGSARPTINYMFKKLTAIWAIMLGAIGVYVAITIFIILAGGAAIELEPSARTALTGVFIGVAILNSGALIMLDRTFRSRSGVTGYLNGRGITALKGSFVDKNLDGEDKLAMAILPHYVQLCLIRWALAEAVGVYGLILVFFTGTMIFPACFYILSVGLMGAMKPAPNEFSELIAFGRTVQ